MDVPLLISTLVLLIWLTGSLGAYDYARSRYVLIEWKRRLGGQTVESRVNYLHTSVTCIRTFILAVLERLGKVVTPRQDAQLSQFKRALVAAGFRQPGAVVIFFGAKFACALMLPLVFLTVLPIEVMKKLPLLHFLLLNLGVVAMGLYVPNVWLQKKVSQRKQRILEGFADSLDLLVVCVEAGLGLDAAITRVGQEMRLVHKELSEELHLLALELRAGLARQQALRNLGQRVDLEEVKSLVALLIQTDRFGTSVSQALRVHSDSIRKQRHLRAEELAAKLPVKLLFPLIFFIFPSLFIVILGSAVVQGVRVLLPALAGR